MSKKVPQYLVKVDGAELSSEDDSALQSITVDLRRSAPGSAELTFNNNANADQSGKAVGRYDSHDLFKPGSVVEVFIGYAEDPDSERHDATGKIKIFEGEVVGTRQRVFENSPRSFIVQAFDYLHRLTRGRKTRTFLDQKFSDILSTVGRDWGLTVDAEDTAFVRDYVIQHNQTDLDFARGIAGWLDFDLHIRHLDDAKQLRFRTPDVASDAVVVAAYEKPKVPEETYLRKFDGRQSLARVVSEVTVRGWDPTQKREIVGVAAASQLYDKMGDTASGVEEVTEKWGEPDRQLVDYKVFSQEEADKIARTKLNEYARTFIRADVEIQGHPLVHPGANVELKLIGKRYSGKYFVESVTHRFTSKVDVGEGYTTRFTAARCGW